MSAVLAPPPPRTAPAKAASSWAAEHDLFERYQSTGAVAIREDLVHRYMPLARDLAFRYVHMGEPLDDLVQVAALGLLKAIDRYDPARGTRFTSYAAPTILGELKRHFRDTGWAVHVPREAQEHALRLGKVSDELSQSLGRSPTAREVAETLGWSVERVIEAREAASTYSARSLDAPMGGEADGEVPSLLETLGGSDGGYGAVESEQGIREAWNHLPPLERRVVQLRFNQDLTQRQIGDIIGCSQMHISRVLRRALNTLSAGAG